ncbi:MAG: septum formation initiator family protein [Deltaproteobacteria bacterium]|nr:septum formation initiator family protein [Deltaproteobacteria bacterium]
MKRLWLVPLIVLLALGYALFDTRSGAAEARRLRDELAAARSRIGALRERSDALRAEAEALRADPFARERVWREELDLARPGEVVVRMPREGERSPRIP